MNQQMYQADDLEYNNYHWTAYNILFSVTMGIGVVGNVMVTMVIFRTSAMRNSTNILLANLAITDLIVLIGWGSKIFVLINPSLAISNLGEGMCVAMPFIFSTVSNTSVLTILAIGFERYIAICQPLKARYICTKSRAFKLCFLTWALAALVCGPQLTFAREKHADSEGTYNYAPHCYQPFNTVLKKVYYITRVGGLFFVPLIILIVLFLLITVHLKRAATQTDLAIAKISDNVPMLTGVNSVSMATGANSVHTSTGVNPMSVSTGAKSISMSTGINSIPMSTGVNSVSITTGANSIPTSTGVNSVSITTGANSIPTSTGVNPMLMSSGAKSMSMSTGINSIPMSTGANSVSGETSVNSAAIKYRNHVVTMLVAVILCFFICQLPYRVFNLLNLFPVIKDQIGQEKYSKLSLFRNLLMYLHSVVNPILYNMMSERFRTSFKNLWRDVVDGCTARCQRWPSVA